MSGVQLLVYGGLCRSGILFIGDCHALGGAESSLQEPHNNPSWESRESSNHSGVSAVLFIILFHHHFQSV